MSIKNWKYNRERIANSHQRLEKTDSFSKGYSLFTIFFFFYLNSFTQHTLHNIPSHFFIDYSANKILVKDSSTLESFYNKLWNYETQKAGQIKILHLGDSHIQAGYFTAKIRELFHENFACGTSARGIVFPYSISNSNGPLNYGIKYNGNWNTQRCIYPDSTCSWGLAGINVSSTNDSLTLKVWCNNKTFDTYYHNKITILFQSQNFSHVLSASSLNGKVKTSKIDSTLGAQSFEFDRLTDTITIYIHKKDSTNNHPFTLQGLILENNLPGITYSELGINGAKVDAFLRCKNFTQQINYYRPDLLVLSLGTNDVFDPNFNDSLFYAHYDNLLKNIRDVLPDAAIIITTVGDCKRNNAVIKETALLRKICISLAKKYNCAVWDLLKIMGGLNSMNKWVDAHLGNKDNIHFLESGYHLQGMLFFNALAMGYNEHTKGWVIHKSTPPPPKEEELLPILLKKIFSTNPKEPMIFSVFGFWVFFLVLLLGYLLVYNRFKWRSFYLTVFSLFFYYKSGGFFFVLLVFSTVLDYLLSVKIYKAKNKSTKTLFLCVSLFINLGLLAFFKYSYFVTDLINATFHTQLQAVNFFAVFSNSVFGTINNVHAILLPVGISFFTFQTLSYTIDVYFNKIQPTEDIIDFAFFVTFFPQLVAGPIVKAIDFLPQINRKYSVTKEDFGKAVFLILTGLFKKVVISDYISVNFVDRIFDAPLSYSGFENLMAMYGYSVQIYCDFSGYSDMAIGIALLLGFHLPLNFNAPYLAANITDFWRRWHISLSTWLKDYVYIPLGGNRKGKIRAYVNLIITMLLGGLWHGAAIKFIVWGALHGAVLALEKAWKEKVKIALPKVIGIVLTFHFVTICWLLFRANNMNIITQMLNQIMLHFNNTNIVVLVKNYQLVFALIALGFAAHLFPFSWQKKTELFLGKLNVFFLSIIAASVALLIFQFKTAEVQPFIYFQF